MRTSSDDNRARPAAVPTSRFLGRSVRPSGKPSALLLAAFFLFVLSIATESIKLGGNLDGAQSSYSPARLAGYLLLLASLFDYRAALSEVPRPVIWWSGFLAVALIGTAILWRYVSLGLALTMPQNVVLFGIGCNVMRRSVGWQLFLLGTLCGVGFASSAQLCGFGVGEADVRNVYVAGVGTLERTSALGEDPNFAASYYAFGIVIGAMALLDKKASWWYRLFGAGVAVVAGGAIVQTGSRGGLLVVAGGLVLIGLVQQGWRARLLASVVGGLVLLVLGVVVASSQIFVERIQQSLETGDTANRTDIWRAAFDLLWDSPVWGFGLQTYSVPLGRLVGVHHVATHNFFLAILMSGGIVGFVLFLGGLLPIFRRSWALRRVPSVAQALVLMGIAIVAGISMNVEIKKWFWLVLAGAYARSAAGGEATAADEAAHWSSRRRRRGVVLGLVSPMRCPRRCPKAPTYR